MTDLLQAVLTQWLLQLHASNAWLYYGILTLSIWLLTLLSRKIAPWFWSSLERDNPVGSKLLQGLPVALLGVVMHGVVMVCGEGAGCTPGVDAEAFWGLLGSGLAVALHHGLQLSKLPYQGELGKLVPKLVAFLVARLRALGGRGGTALVLLFALPLGTTGCLETLAAVAPIVTQVLHAITDAQMLLDDIDRTAQSFFKLRPNPELQARYDAAMAKARQGLVVANHATAGAQDLTQQDLDRAFVDFKRAYQELEVLIKACGMVRRPGALSTPGVPQVELRPLLALRIEAPE